MAGSAAGASCVQHIACVRRRSVGFTGRLPRHFKPTPGTATTPARRMAVPAHSPNDTLTPWGRGPAAVDLAAARLEVVGADLAVGAVEVGALLWDALLGLRGRAAVVDLLRLQQLCTWASCRHSHRRPLAPAPAVIHWQHYTWGWGSSRLPMAIIPGKPATGRAPGSDLEEGAEPRLHPAPLSSCRPQ